MRWISAAVFAVVAALQVCTLPLFVGETKAAPAAEKLDLYGDPLPAGAVLRLGTVRLRHSGQVNSVAFAPDGKVLVTAAGNEAEIRMWDVATGRLIRSIELSGRNRPERVACSPDGTAIAVVCERDTVQVWDARSGQKRWERAASTTIVHDAIFAPDSNSFATTADDGTLKLWDTHSGAELLTLHVTRRQWYTTPVAFSHDGTLLACGAGSVIRVYDLNRGEEAGTIDHAHGYEVSSLAFAPDGKTLFSSGFRIQEISRQEVVSFGELRMWNVAKRTMTREFFGDKSVPENCVFALSRDGGTLVSEQSNQLAVWDVASGKLTRTIPSFWLPLAASQKRIDGVYGMQAKALALSPDGKTIACSAAPLNNVLLWGIASGRQKPAFPEAHCGAIDGTACTADGARIASCSEDGTVRLWSGADGKPLQTFVLSDFFPCRIQSVAFAHDGTTLAAAGRDQKQDEAAGFVRIWDASSGVIRREVEAGSNVARVAISNDGSKLAIERTNLVPINFGNGMRGRMSAQPVVMIVDARSGAKRPLLKLKGELRSLAFSSDGTSINTIDRQGTFTVTKIATGESIRTCVVRDAPTRPQPTRRRGQWKFQGLCSAAVSADGTVAVVSAFGSDGATIWDLIKGSQIGRLAPEDESSPAHIVAISPDKRVVATGSWNLETRTFRIWETKGGRLLGRYVRSGGAASMEFTPDSRRLITGMFDGTALIWDVPKL